jgi:hypothetical protein
MASMSKSSSLHSPDGREAQRMRPAKAAMLTDFEDAASEQRLQEWRDRLLRQLLGGSLHLLLGWCAHHTGQ